MKVDNSRPLPPTPNTAAPDQPVEVKTPWAPPSSNTLDAAWKRVRTGPATGETPKAPAGHTLPLRELSRMVGRLGQSFNGQQGTDQLKDILQQLTTVLAKLEKLALPPEMSAQSALKLVGASGQTEKALHQTISAAPGEPAGKDAAVMLSALQGRPGQQPLGYAQSATTASSQERSAQAQQIKQSGALGAGESAKPQVTEEERKAINDIVAKADDDLAVNLSENPKALAAMAPEHKAKLIKELMSGSTSDSEDRAIARLLQSCTSKAEYDKVLNLAGGKKEVFGELDDKTAKSMCSQLDGKWETEQKQATTQAVSLLEQCQSPEEAKQIATELGSTDLKHQVKDPEVLKRLEAVSMRFDLPALAYGMPPQAVEQKRSAINQAITKEDSDLATKLAEDKDAMKVASPSEKAGLIKELMRGWTKDRQDMAMYKILSSCTSKAEFDEVMQLSGGKDVVKEIDHSETRAKMDELMGAWGRTDLAEDKKRASQFANVMADPQKQAELSATRPPTTGEVSQVGGTYKLDPKDASDPLMQQAGQAMDTVRGNIQNKAFDINWDPQAKTELVLEQRRREVEGKPKLDWTQLTAEADKITSDPNFDKSVKAFQKQWNDSNPVDKLDDKEAGEKYMTLHMEQVGKKYGLSEQTMKALVTQRMGQIYGEGAGEMAAHSDAIVGPMKKELARIEATKGPNSPEAAELRERIAKFDKVTGEYKNHLGNVGEVYKSMFPVPASFWEGFVNAFSFIADIAAAVASCFPGIGQAIGATYFGVKAVVSAAKGDMLGMFSSVASALPGLGSAIGGAAGAAVKTAGRALQTGIGVGSSIADGNVMGALGSLAGAGAGVSPVLGYAQRGLNLVDGISRGDVTSIANAAGGLVGPLSNNPAVQGIVYNPLVQGVAQATQTAVPFIDAVAKGDVSRALGSLAGQLGPLTAGNPDAQRALSLVSDGAAFVNALQSGSYGKALSTFGTSFERMGAGPEAQAVIHSFGQMSDVLTALGTGNPQKIAGVMNSALGEIAGGSFTQAFAGVSRVAGQMLESPESKALLDLAGAGSRFLGAVGNGDLMNTLNAVRTSGASELTGWLESAQPLVRSMASGEYQRALGELRKNPLTAGLADQMSHLDPIADLAQRDFLKSLDQTLANLDRLSRLNEELHRFKDLEDAARRLQERFGQDVDSLAENLLERSGYVPAPHEVEQVQAPPAPARAAWFGPLR